MSVEMNLGRLAWIDIETTGLNPEHCSILEVGVVITDANFEPIDCRSFLVNPGASFGVELAAVSMHGADLFRQVKEDGRPLPFVEVALLEYLEYWGALGSPMCGASVHFDRAFLRRHMPSFERAFHYRNFDVSTLKILAELRGVELPPKREVHRAIPDLEDAIALAKIGAGWVR
jgi:oligoribonuclease